MALDIRLDFIRNIEPQAIARMTELRKTFIALDEQLKAINDEMNGESAGLRACALARTNLEIALQYTIKSVCILGEIKPHMQTYSPD